MVHCPLLFQNYCRMVIYQIHPDNESIDVYHSYRICPRIARGFWLVYQHYWEKARAVEPVWHCSLHTTG